MPEVDLQAVRSRYLESDKTFNIRKHMDQLEKEEKSGLKGVEIRETQKQLGKDDFLRLLITQLSHQDPTNPVQDQQFIAQMAQFSSLEQMKNISQGIQRMETKQAYSLVGKFVAGPDFVSGEEVSGVAAALIVDKEGKSFLRVNGRSVDIDKIQLISDPSLFDKPKKEVEPAGGISPKREIEAVPTSAQMKNSEQSGTIAPKKASEPTAKVSEKKNVEKPALENTNSPVEVSSSLESLKEFPGRVSDRDKSYNETK